MYKRQVYPTPEPEEWNRPRTYEIVNLPHDYNISLETQKERSTGPAGGYYPGCSVEYEKDLCIPDEWKNKLVFLEFDGVYHNAVLWICLLYTSVVSGRLDFKRFIIIHNLCSAYSIYGISIILYNKIVMKLYTIIS